MTDLALLKRNSVRWREALALLHSAPPLDEAERARIERELAQPKHGPQAELPLLLPERGPCR